MKGVKKIAAERQVDCENFIEVLEENIERKVTMLNFRSIEQNFYYLYL